MVYNELYYTLNDEQKVCFNRLVSGENIFITGNAGTGKSYLVKVFDEYCKINNIGLVKTASTGIAANEINGATIHHQFKLKTELDFDNPTSYPSFLDVTDILLIDEISMVSINIFDKLIKYIINANEKRLKTHVKPIQLVFCGDFFQLPPVITKEERPFLIDYYKQDIKEGYCFQSKFWRILNIHLINLTQVMRQKDEQFCKALDKCKYGDINCLSFIRNNTANTPNPTAIWVCGKNSTAFEKNKEELSKIRSKCYFSKAEYDGEATKADNLCDDEFIFKVGARVVMLANDTKDYKYQNGTVGTIIGFRPINAICAEDITTIIVDFGKGITANIEKKTYDKKEYGWKEFDNTSFDNNGNQITTKNRKLDLKTVGSATQFPMRLGYAVTIHKSQGQTYEAMNIIPEIFTVGQLYVALSRCKDINKIYIQGQILNNMVMTSRQVIDFYNNPNEYSFFGKSEDLIPVFIPRRYAKSTEEFFTKLKQNGDVLNTKIINNFIAKFKIT